MIDGSLQLHEAGLRVTRTRLVLVSLLQALGGHRSADELLAAARSRGTPLSRATVYHALAALERAGLILVVDAGVGPTLYESATGRHHHLICRACGRVIDVPALRGEPPRLEPDVDGVRVDQARVVFRGLCPSCAARARAVAARAAPSPGSGRAAKRTGSGAKPAGPAEEARRLVLPVRLRFDEATPSGHCRASAQLRAMQDVAWVHAAEAGFDLPWYRSRGRFWLVRCLDLAILQPVGPGTVLDVSTEVVAMRRIWARRESDFVTADGTLVAHGLADWVMTTTAGAPARIPEEVLALFGGRDQLQPAHVAPATPPPGAAEWRFRVAHRDLDPMGHANNAVYVDWVDEAVARAGGAADLENVPRRYRLEYLLPAAQGAELLARAWRSDGTWHVRLDTAEGAELLRARLAVGPAAHRER
ncbi:MAG: transcriptional repressor [Candidatus Limnocylindrales bacterium]